MMKRKHGLEVVFIIIKYDKSTYVWWTEICEFQCRKFMELLLTY